MNRVATLLATAALIASVISVGADEIVRNSDFESGGRTWSAGWRPLGGEVRLRRVTEDDRCYLSLLLRGDGDGGVVQQVQLPAHTKLSLRMLATAWDTPGGGVIATLVRSSDGVVLCELTADGIERGEVARNFETGSGGPAELLLRLVGDRGGEGEVDYLRVAAPVSESAGNSVAYGPSDNDLALGPGEGLRIEPPPASERLRAAAEMLDEAVEDLGSFPLTINRRTLRVRLLMVSGPDQPESYRLIVDRTGATIEAASAAGAQWAMMTLIDLMRSEPGGGVRILAADVAEAPDLQWRAGWVEGSGTMTVNAVRKLARLKMNVALIPATTNSQGEGDWEVIGRRACDEARRHGLEPVAALLCVHGATAEGLKIAVETVARNLPVNYLLVIYPGAWDAELGDAVLDAVARAGRPITVLTALDTDRLSTTKAAAALAIWPESVIAICGPECVRTPELAEALRAATGRGVRYLLAADHEPAAMARAALSARVAGAQCLGLVALDAAPEAVANAAWRVPR